MSLPPILVIYWPQFWFTVGVIAGCAFTVFGYWLTGKK
jgi:hypothetical protein